jgi:polyisoprenoid-binding protein YceI
MYLVDMIMTKLLVLAIGMIIANPEAGVEQIEVNVSTSSVKWVGAKVGGSHNGSISLTEGALDMEDGVLTGGSFVIDMTTINCEDLEGEYKGKLEGHLKSDDFFGVEKFPTASFSITKAVAQGPGKYKIEGDLTIKGITKSIKFPAMVEETEGAYTATADITVDRSEYDVKYGSGSFFDGLGDKVIYDDFTLAVSLTTSK